jgi:hypothetical protein
MQIVRSAACIFGALSMCIAGCATGTNGGDDDIGTDSGITQDTGASKDTGTPPKDTGAPKDTGTTPEAAPCGSGCGSEMCCGSTCVDTTQDDNNCGTCGKACGTSTCCSSSCIDTMGTDKANCGGCGIACATTCVGGVCQTGACTVDLGKCAHSPCVTGVALSSACDSEGIVFAICLAHAACCSTKWDATCVLAATAVESSSCGGC